MRTGRSGVHRCDGLCACASDADATGRRSIDAKTASGGAPSSSSMTAATSAHGEARVRSKRVASVRVYAAGTR